jgi:hypothetical protein
MPLKNEVSGDKPNSERMRARRALEEGLRSIGKLPELKKIEPPKKSFFGDPFSPETRAELDKLPALMEDNYELNLIIYGLSEPTLMDYALRLAKLRNDDARKG